MPYDDSYAPVSIQDEEEERLRRGEYAPVMPESAPPIAPPASGASYAPASPTPEIGSTADLESKVGGPVNPYAPAMGGEPKRPAWSEYEPAERHGWAKFGSVLAAFNPIANSIVNEMPQEKAEARYKAATGEFDKTEEQRRLEGNAASTEVEQAARTRQADAATAKDDKAAQEVTLAQQHANAVQQAIAHGQNPDNSPVVQELADQITGLQKQTATTDPKKDIQTQLEAEMAKPVPNKDIVKKLQQRLRDIDPLSEDRIRDAESRAADAAARAAEHADTSKREKAITYWQPALDSAERLNVMTKNYEEAVNHHDQQAMLSLLANHLGMTMGLQKGARITQTVMDEAAKSQPWLASIRAKFDKDGYLSGVTLSPAQMKQMVDLGFGRYREDAKKGKSASAFVGVTDEPERHLSRETATQYLEQAGGDRRKAEAAAAADGWKF